MTKERTKANQIVLALQQDPELLFHVLSLLNDVKIASPWTREENTRKTRRDTSGKLLCRVYFSPNHSLPWRAAVAKDLVPYTPKDNTGKQPRLRAFPTESDALDWCDLTLTFASYTLA